MKKKIAILVTLILFISGTFLNSSVAIAESLSELEKKEQELENKNSNISSEINSAEDEINQLEGKVNSLKAETQKLDNSIYQTEQDIAAKNNEITEKDADIAELASQIEELKAKIEKRDNQIADRARAIQASGGVISYLDVLLGANSFTDFISRVSAVSTILEADKSILEEHKKDKDSLQESKILLETEKLALEKLKEQLENEKSQLEKQKQEKDNLIAELKEELEIVEEYFMDLQEEQALIAAQKKAIERAKQAEIKRIEEEKRKKEEEERRRQEEAKKNNNNNSVVENPPAVGNAKFIRPASGRISSEYSYRLHPIHGYYKMHLGIDIANSTGTPIYSSASGVVARSYYSPSFGNVIFINHYIDGNIYTTVYAHLSRRGVNEGDSVQQGQHIGDMGSTGDSTGPHLHFQIHEGEYSRSTAVNPRKYVSF